MTRLPQVAAPVWTMSADEQMLKDMEMDGAAGAMSRTAPHMLANEQKVAAKGARTNYTGGGFAIKNPERRV